MGLIPGLGRSLEVENGTLLQYFCLKNSTGKGAWQATVHGAAVLDMTEHARTQTHRHTHTHTHTHTRTRAQSKQRQGCQPYFSVTSGALNSGLTFSPEETVEQKQSRTGESELRLQLGSPQECGQVPSPRGVLSAFRTGALGDWT